MKQTAIRLALLTALLACTIFTMSSCGSNTVTSPEDTTGSATESTTPADSETLEKDPGDTASLEELMGTDYKDYIVETITMQMENRMELEPEVVFFPVRDDKPLTDYVAIDETLSYTAEENGDVTILLPAGSVTDEAHGDQSFSIPNPHPGTDQ